MKRIVLGIVGIVAALAAVALLVIKKTNTEIDMPEKTE